MLNFILCQVVYYLYTKKQLEYTSIVMRSNEYHTETQNTVLECLQQQKETTVSVQNIMEYIHTKKNTANITTVYRILNKLEAKGLVIRYNADDGKKALFQYVEPEAGCQHHLHVQCTCCGKIIHLDCPEIAQMLTHISTEHNIEIVCSTSLLYGICADCKTNSEENN